MFKCFSSITEVFNTVIIYLCQMDYINTSHPSFIGGSKAVELALEQHRTTRMSTPIKVRFSLCENYLTI